MFEFKNFAAGTKAVMDAVVMATQNGATTIIGETFYHSWYLRFHSSSVHFVFIF